MRKATKPLADPPALPLRSLLSSPAPSWAVAAPLSCPRPRCQGSEHHPLLPAARTVYPERRQSRQGRGAGLAGPDLLVPCGSFLVQQPALMQQLREAETCWQQGDPCHNGEGPAAPGGLAVQLQFGGNIIVGAGKKRTPGIPTSSAVVWVRPSPEQEPGRVGKGQPSHSRAGARQPCASREHVPGSTASPRDSWQAAENKLLLVPSGGFSRLSCQVLHARATLAGPGLRGREGSRRCLLPQPLALPRSVPSQLQSLCQSQKQDDPAHSSRMGHRLGTGSCLAALMTKRHHLPTCHGRAFPSSFPPSFAI